MIQIMRENFTMFALIMVICTSITATACVQIFGPKPENKLRLQCEVVFASESGNKVSLECENVVAK